MATGGEPGGAVRGPVGAASSCRSAVRARASSAPPSRRTSQRAAVRVHRRHRVEVSISLVSESNLFSGQSENLSVGGVFVVTDAIRPAVGAEIELRVELLTLREPLRCLGRVAWHRERGPAGLGVEFLGLGEAEIAALREFLRYRAPLRQE